jgi:hypothetical protein
MNEPEYIDVRDMMDGYKRVPCDRDGCDDYTIVTQGFGPDEWPCRAHRPERLDVSHLTDDVTVRL